MKEIVPCLWFDDQAEQAARFYVSVFPNSKVGRISYCGDWMPSRRGTVLTVSFRLDGNEFLALNGGPQFKFTEAVSLTVNCDTQAEIDRMWKKLSAGGKVVECGWLKDRYGLCWQIVPSMMQKMITDPAPGRSDRVMRALMKMKRLDIAKLKKAYARR